MANDQQKQEQQAAPPAPADRQQQQQQPQNIWADTADGLKDKKPEDLTPEELRLMADTMPGDGPGD